MKDRGTDYGGAWERATVTGRVWVCSQCGNRCEPDDGYSDCCNEPATMETREIEYKRYLSDPE